MVRSYIVCPLLSPEVARPETNQFIGRGHPYARPSQKWFLVGCKSPFMRLVQHLTALGAMSAWSVKIQRAPSRHCMDARVYGHMTTAMHEYTPSRLSNLFVKIPNLAS